MKKLFLLLLLSTSALAQNQVYTLADLVPIDSATSDIVYEGVVETPGVSAADLYHRAKTYYLKTFNSASSVIQVDERDKRVGGKGLFQVANQRKQSVLSAPPTAYNVTIDIQVKDGRYRYEFSQFSVASVGGMPAIPFFTKVYGKTIKEKAADSIRLFDESIKAQVASLNQYMTGKLGSKDF